MQQPQVPGAQPVGPFFGLPPARGSSVAAFVCRLVAYGIGVAGLLTLVGGVVIGTILIPVAPSGGAEAVIFTVPAGSTAEEIGMRLEEAGLIRSARHFQLANRVLGLDERLQAGEYLLSPEMDLLTIIRRLEQGQVRTVRVVIPEGVNLRQIADILDRHGLVNRERFLELALDDSKVYGANRPIRKPVPSLEGYLFPDTYILTPSMTEEQIIRRMVSRFLEVAAPVIREHPAPLGLDLHQVVTLASIVEAEALYAREHPIIASVFLNRLRSGMPLQADPTVQYVLEERRSRLLYADLEVDSPYNTYRYSGLPPGPISSPGLSAIRGVLSPAETDYYFFVARGDGTHVFTRTFNEHVRARRQVGR
ncbi:MAG: endolytic transglycosylase MltG [Firmicutes bacterium]|nr:endolytic transglycosylase MltG [Bacillota bacterium]